MARFFAQGKSALLVESKSSRMVNLYQTGLTISQAAEIWDAVDSDLKDGPWRRNGKSVTKWEAWLLGTYPKIFRGCVVEDGRKDGR